MMLSFQVLHNLMLLHLFFPYKLKTSFWHILLFLIDLYIAPYRIRLLKYRLWCRLYFSSVQHWVHSLYVMISCSSICFLSFPIDVHAAESWHLTFKNNLCLCLCVCHMNVDTHKGRGGYQVLQSEMVNSFSCPTWVLCTKLRSSRRTALIPTYAYLKW